jgi:hypothetical protein
MMWRDRLLRVLPLAVAAVGLWLTLGAVSASGETATERLAVLPPARLLIAFLAGAVVLAHVLPASPARLRPLYLAFLPWLPWLPLPIPPGFLLWHGPLASAAWILIGCLLLAGPAGAAWTRVLETAPAKQLALAILLAAASYTAAAWRMAPVLPDGDEPHYVVIAQSLLYDGDLKIENNHRRGDYRAYVRRELRPDYLRRGLDREIYSIHAPGLAAVVLPAFAIAGYPGIVVFLSIVSALGAALVWHAGWRITGSPAAAWAGWAAVALSMPFYFHAFTVYPDGLGAVLVMTGAYALALPERPRASRWRAAWHGAALALLPWLHTRYAVLAGTLGALILFRLWQQPDPAPLDSIPTRVRRCLPFLVIPALSAAGWLWFFYAIYGEFNPAAPYAGNTQTSLSNASRGVSGLLLDQQFGLLPNAPVYLVAFSGIGALWRAHRRLASELLLVAVPYTVAVACYQMWWGGHSSPVRFIVPVLLPFGLSAAAYWERSTSGGRGTFNVLLGASVALALALAWVDRGTLVYNFRDGFALWMDRAAPLVNLPRAVPSLFRNTATVTAMQAAAWAAAGIVSWLVCRAVGGPAAAREDSDESRRAGLQPCRGRDRIDRSRGTTHLWLALACTLTVGATLGWRAAFASSLERGTGLSGVARAAVAHGTVLQLPAMRHLPAREAFAGVPVPSATRRDARPPEGLLFVGRDLPAGRYRVVAQGHAALSGTIEATVGRRVAPFLRTALDNTPPGATPMLIDLPVGARVLTISGDTAAARGIDEVALQIQAFSPDQPPTFAQRVVRYGDVLVWFLDEGASAEPEGWWVLGGGSAAVVVERTSGNAPQELLVRNGGAKNRVALRAGRWSIAMDLAPGEERRVTPPRLGRLPLVVTSEAGFRPSTVDSKSRDDRFLGVWLQIR